MENRKYSYFFLLGAILMIIGPIIGNFIFFEYPFQMGAPLIGEERNSIYSKILFIFEYLTLYGGISIIIGLLIVNLDYSRIGIFIISLGIIISIISLIFTLIIIVMIGILFNKLIEILFSFIISFGGIVLTSIIITSVARLKLIKNKNFNVTK